MRLGPLTTEEIKEIALKYVNSRHDFERSPYADGASNDHKGLIKTQRHAESSVGTFGEKTVQDIKHIEEELSQKEQGLLLKAILELTATDRPDLKSPRAIRAFTLKYKLCRLILLEVKGHPLNPDAVVNALRDVALNGECEEDTETLIAQAVQQVS